MRFSYTKLSTLKCPWKYVKKYVKWEKPPVVDEVNFLVGSAIHQALATWISSGEFMKGAGARARLSTMCEEAFERVSRERKHSADLQRLESLRQDLLGMVNPTVDALKNHRLLTRRVQTELSLTYPVMDGQHQVQVIVDLLVFKNPSTAVLVDFKTTKAAQYLDHFQLEFYQRLVDEFSEFSVSEAVYLLTRSGEVVPVELRFSSQGEFFDYLHEAINTAVALHRDPESAEPVPGEMCRFCEYASICPVGKTV